MDYSDLSVQLNFYVDAFQVFAQGTQGSLHSFPIADLPKPCLAKLRRNDLFQTQPSLVHKSSCAHWPGQSDTHGLNRIIWSHRLTMFEQLISFMIIHVSAESPVFWHRGCKKVAPKHTVSSSLTPEDLQFQECSSDFWTNPNVAFWLSIRTHTYAHTRTHLSSIRTHTYGHLLYFLCTCIFCVCVYISLIVIVEFHGVTIMFGHF